MEFPQFPKCPICGSTGFDHPEYGHIDNPFKVLIHTQPEDGSGVPTYYTEECSKCGFSIDINIEDYLQMNS